MMAREVVTPVKTGVQSVYKSFKILDSGFRRNDEKGGTMGSIFGASGRTPMIGPDPVLRGARRA